MSRMKDENGNSAVSYVSVTLDSRLNLTVHTSRGRPTTAETIKTNKQVKADLRALRQEMNYKDGTEILLALSLATNSMTKRVHMFPEVFYLDVTANTNILKRDLFLMVVKEANGSTAIGNVTVIPSNKRWVYSFIYRHFFLRLYGEQTILRNRLCITDDDTSEWLPLEDCIKTVPHWKGTVHMLCLFHALTLVFFQNVHPKLPTKNGRITNIGRTYGKSKSCNFYLRQFFFSYYFHITNVLSQVSYCTHGCQASPLNVKQRWNTEGHRTN